MKVNQQLSTVKTIGWLLSHWLPDKAILPPAITAIAVVNLLSDSRRLSAGDLFIALPGERHHGADYIDQAVARGAAAILLPSTSAELSYQWQCGIPLIYLPDLVRHIGAIAVHFYGDPSSQATVIGITGTNGKTTCAHLSAQLAALCGRSSGVLGTLGCCLYPANYDPTVPPDDLPSTASPISLTTPDMLTIQANMSEMIAAGAQLLVLEASSHGLVQGRVAAVDIDVAIFTNLTHDHLDYHGDMESYGKAKALLFNMPSLTKAVINIDDAFGRQLVNQLSNTISIVTYSIDNPAADFHLTAVQCSNKGSSAKLHSPFGSAPLTTELLGRFNLSNLLAALAASITGADKWRQRLAYIQQLKPVVGRMEPIINDADIDVIIDFAHTPDALRHALTTVTTHCSGRLWCLFGCGGGRDNIKRPLMAAAAEQFADHIVVTSDNPRDEQPQKIIDDICAGFSSAANYRVVADRAVAIGEAIEHMQPRDLLLIAGKGHENYQQIGDQKRPFSDRAQALAALRLRRQRQLQNQTKPGSER